MAERFIKNVGFIFFLFVVFLGGLAACSSKRPLIVPTTPPSEIDENPGPDAPPVSEPDCENPENCFEEGLNRWKDGDRDKARLVMNDLRNRFPGTRWAARASFIRGMWAAEIGSPFADHYLRDVTEQIPALEPYALFFSAKGHFSGGRFEEAGEALNRFFERHPGSVLAPEAALLRAEVFMSKGQCGEAVRSLDTLPARVKKGLSLSETLLLKAECAERNFEYDEAVRFLQRIWFYHSGTPQADEAERRLERLQSWGNYIPEPSLEARRERANYLMSSARFKEAESAFEALAEDFPDEFRDSLRIRQGEALFRLKNHEKAIRLLKEVTEESTDPREVHKSLFWLARIAVRQDEDSRLMEIERELAGMAPGSPQRVRALFYVGDAFDDSGDRENASKIYRTIMKEFPATRTAEESAWRLGWMAYRHGDYDEAIRVFHRYVKGNPSDPVNGRYWYWIGRSADKSGKEDLADKAYEKTCDLKRLSLYCQLATGRIRSRGQVQLNPAAGVVDVSFTRNGGTKGLNGAEYVSPAPEAEGLPLSDSPGFLVARELLVLKMVPEATRELSLLTLKYKDPESILYLSGLFSKIGDPYRSMRLVRLYFNDWIVEKSEETPLWFWELAFPSSIVLETLEKYPVDGLDPYLVSAIVREESAFNPGVVSRAGAIGLMQLMPYTGKRVAHELGLGNIGEEDLKNPTLNIRLGSSYLKGLIERFAGNWVLAVAAYNAGPEAVSKWVGDGIEDIEEFVESIPYRETRNYTKRVSRSYYEYRRISKSETPEASLRSRPVFP